MGLDSTGQLFLSGAVLVEASSIPNFFLFFPLSWTGAESSVSLDLASLRRWMVSSDSLSLGMGVSAVLISNPSLCMFQLDTAETRVEWLALSEITLMIE